jgi:hypothetical protein
VLLEASASAAQTPGAMTGALNGKVTDSTAAVLRGVNIVIASDALIGSSGTRTAVTNGEGLYRFTALPPGEYTLTFTLEGFKSVPKSISTTRPSDQHHVVRLDVAMNKARTVHGGHRLTKLDADVNDVGLAEDLALFENLFERSSLDTLHPQPDPVVDTVGAVDGDHVRMAHAREQTTPLDKRGADRTIRGCFTRQKLERHFAIEPRVHPIASGRRLFRRSSSRIRLRIACRKYA